MGNEWDLTWDPTRRLFVALPQRPGAYGSHGHRFSHPAEKCGAESTRPSTVARRRDGHPSRPRLLPLGQVAQHARVAPSS